MKKVWKQYKEYILLAGYVVIIWAVYQFGVTVLVKNIENTADEIQKSKIDQELREERVQNLSRLREQNDIMEEKKGELDVLVTEENLVSVVEELENIGRRANVETSIEITQEDESKDVGAKKDEEEKIIKPAHEEYFTITTKLTGQYNSMMYFLSGVENMRYLADVTEVSIKKQDKEAFDVSKRSSIFSVTPETVTENKEVEEVQEGLEAEIKIVLYKKTSGKSVNE